MRIKNIVQENKQVYYTLLLIATAGIAYYYCFDTKIFLGGDNVYYYNLGKALATGQGYVTLNQPDLPLATHYPPGYPALIAVEMLVGSYNITAIKILNGLFYLGGIIASFYLFKKLSRNIHASFTSSLLIALSPVMLKYSDIMMSEISFLFFTILTLFLFVNTNEEESPYNQPIFYGFLLCLAFSFHIKSLGIGLVGGFFLYFLYQKNWQWLLSTTGGFILLALPWFIRNQIAGGGSYVHQLLMVNPYRPELGMAGPSDLAMRLWHNFQRYLVVEIPHGLFPPLKRYIGSYTFWGWVTGLAIVLLIGWGIYKLKKYSALITAYLISTFGILLLWPSVWYGPRFMVAIVPILLFCCIFGGYHFFRSLLEDYHTPKSWHPLFFILIALTFLSGLKRLNKKAQYPYLKNWNAYIQMAKWTKNNTPSKTIVSCRKPAIFNLFAQRKTFRYKDTKDKEALIKDLEDHHTNLVVLDRLGFSSTSRYLYPAIKKYRKRFKTVVKSKNIKSYLLKFQSDPTQGE